MSDEHGPDIPYRCPTCRSTDETLYIVCNHPMCPDGRDHGPQVRYQTVYDEPITSYSRSWVSALVGWAVAVALLVWSLWPHSHF
jgi:hypothetical protein